MMSSTIGARISARTNVGKTRKKSVMRMMTESVRPPTNPDTIPSSAPNPKPWTFLPGGVANLPPPVGAAGALSFLRLISQRSRFTTLATSSLPRGANASLLAAIVGW